MGEITSKGLVSRFKRGIAKGSRAQSEDEPEEISEKSGRFKQNIMSSRAEREEGGPERITERHVSAYYIPVPYGQLPQPEGQRARSEKIEGISITELPERLTISRAIQEDESEPINLSYPLIPASPKKGDLVFAYADVQRDMKERKFVYKILEPSVSQQEWSMIESIKRRLEERLEIDISRIGAVEAKSLLKQEIAKAFYDLRINIDQGRQIILSYYIERDILGLGKIEPLIHDPNIEDISADGIGIPIFVYHRNPRFGSLQTNISFETKEEIDSFITILAQKCNKTISIAEPLLDGSLPDGSRVQATMGSDIARRGSNFTIRKFSDLPLTPTHMVKYRTMSSLELAYLWLAVEHGQSVLISGGTATGKTSLLNALSLFIRPTLKIISIEDTAELRLPLTHWIPHVARSPLSVKEKVGEVTLFDLLKASLRQRPDYIILGEVRGKEAFVLFQQIATGHAAMATIHAATMEQLVDRLVTPPINLPARLLENIDIVVFLVMSRSNDMDVRKADAIFEMEGIENERPVTRKIFEWNPPEDKFEPKGESLVLHKIARRSGKTEEQIREEILRRRMILDWMYKQGIYDYRDVGRVIHTYYSDPSKIIDMILER
ncbi:MAG: type II/IV secretion system ATPase subunit [Candidatus Aenigmarchaeota archaeon]|nr:type II/IV secretion system ATPase subunit [Candidatus Aenigmarchaeota archaeon]